MKLCKNCKYISFLGHEYLSYCMHERAVYYTSVVTGVSEYYNCSHMLSLNKACGSDAKLFQPRLSMLERIKQWMKNRKSITKE